MRRRYGVVQYPRDHCSVRTSRRTLGQWARGRGRSPAEAAMATHFETNANGVPFDVSAIVYFKGNRTLHLHCGFRHALRQSLRVVGTRRVAVMDDFVLPRKGLPSYYIEEMSLTDMDVYSTTRRTEVVEETGSNFVQEVCLWRNFALLAHISGRNSEEENGSNGVTVKTSDSM